VTPCACLDARRRMGLNNNGAAPRKRPAPGAKGRNPWRAGHLTDASQIVPSVPRTERSSMSVSRTRDLYGRES